MIFGFLPQNVKTKAVAVAFSIAWLEAGVEPQPDEARARDRLAAFRQELYRCFSARADALFELAEAVFCAGSADAVAWLCLLCQLVRGPAAVCVGGAPRPERAAPLGLVPPEDPVRCRPVWRLLWEGRRPRTPAELAPSVCAGGHQLPEGRRGRCSRGLPTGRGELWSWHRKKPGCSTTTTSAPSTSCWA